MIESPIQRVYKGNNCEYSIEYFTLTFITTFVHLYLYNCLIHRNDNAHKRMNKTKNRQFMTFNPQKSMCTLLLAIYHKRQSAFLYICVNSELPIKIFILYIFTYTLSMNAIMQYLYVCWWMREFLCVQLLPFIMIVLHTVTFDWITVHENVSLKKI